MADVIMRTDARAKTVRHVRNMAWREAVKANDPVSWAVFNGLDLKVGDELKEPRRTRVIRDCGWGGGLQRANQ